jgi:hypothetical protein
MGNLLRDWEMLLLIKNVSDFDMYLSNDDHACIALTHSPMIYMHIE